MFNGRPWLIIACVSLVFLAAHSVQGQQEKEKDKGEAKPAAKMIDRPTQDAINAALEFLAKNQHADGSWGTGTQKGGVAVTGLAGLAFLASGFEPGDGKYGKNITSALMYILKQEVPARPGFMLHAQAQLSGPMYGQAFGTLFLAEANRKVKDKDLKKKLDELLGRAVKLIIDSQNAEGGLRYFPTPRDADISVTSCQVLALRSAEKAGVEVPKGVMQKAITYVAGCQDADNGGFRYQQPKLGRAGFARSGCGVAVLQPLGKDHAEAVQKGLDYLKDFQPDKNKVGFQDPEARIHYFFGHYFAAQVMREAGGERWSKWYPAIRDDLLTHSDFRQDDGSWADRHFDPHYCTAMAVLILQTAAK